MSLARVVCVVEYKPKSGKDKDRQAMLRSDIANTRPANANTSNLQHQNGAKTFSTETKVPSTV